MYREMGQRIRELRLSCKLTQEQLSEILNISSSYLGSVERGDKNLSFQKLLELRNIFNTTMDFIVMGEGHEGRTGRIDYNPFLHEVLNESERKFMMKACTAIIPYNLLDHELQFLAHMVALQSKQISKLRN